jgi:anti-sigma factor ChrR (cupin superfamily)
MEPTKSAALENEFVPTDGQTDVIDVNSMEWQTIGPKVRCKVLYRDESTGASTVLFNFAPGAVTPLHVHTGIEQTYVIEGSLEDHDSVIAAGNFAVRKAGSAHQACAPQGSLHIAFFSKPVRNIDSGVTPFSATAKTPTK